MMIEKLYQISKKHTKHIIGLMSGTSLDGLDLALCRFEGFGKATKVEVLQFQTISYTSQTKALIQEVFAKKQADLQQITLLNNFLGNLYAEMVLDCLKQWNTPLSMVDCIASHGQTIFHAPKRLHKQEIFGNATLQIADADQIAVKTGIITISDFRQKHIAAGGEGAPLAVYGDYLLFSSEKENRVLLNIGGIANLTFLPKSLDSQRVFATDVGAGNTFLDYFSQKFFQVPYDREGQIARSGKLEPNLLTELFSLDFFGQAFPKSTGQETFRSAWVEEILANKYPEILPADVLCTLTHFTAEAIGLAIRKLGLEEATIYLSGGGAYNTFLVDLLAKKSKIKLFDELGIAAEAKEAVLFALLANETLSGSTIGLAGVTPVCMGKISLP
ncbi:MAG: anhydro-N-acetylmuramic acid kinase AnmK [Raineya sp.]